MINNFEISKMEKIKRINIPEINSFIEKKSFKLIKVKIELDEIILLTKFNQIIFLNKKDGSIQPFDFSENNLSNSLENINSIILIKIYEDNLVIAFENGLFIILNLLSKNVVLKFNIEIKSQNEKFNIGKIIEFNEKKYLLLSNNLNQYILKLEKGFLKKLSFDIISLNTKIKDIVKIGSYKNIIFMISLNCFYIYKIIDIESQKLLLIKKEIFNSSTNIKKIITFDYILYELNNNIIAHFLFEISNKLVFKKLLIADNTFEYTLISKIDVDNIYLAKIMDFNYFLLIDKSSIVKIYSYVPNSNNNNKIVLNEFSLNDELLYNIHLNSSNSKIYKNSDFFKYNKFDNKLFIITNEGIVSIQYYDNFSMIKNYLSYNNFTSIFTLIKNIINKEIHIFKNEKYNYNNLYNKIKKSIKPIIKKYLINNIENFQTTNLNDTMNESINFDSISWEKSTNNTDDNKENDIISILKEMLIFLNNLNLNPYIFKQIKFLFINNKMYNKFIITLFTLINEKIFLIYSIDEMLNLLDYIKESLDNIKDIYYIYHNKIINDKDLCDYILLDLLNNLNFKEINEEDISNLTNYNLLENPIFYLELVSKFDNIKFEIDLDFIWNNEIISNEFMNYYWINALKLIIKLRDKMNIKKFIKINICNFNIEIYNIINNNINFFVEINEVNFLLDNINNHYLVNLKISLIKYLSLKSNINEYNSVFNEIINWDENLENEKFYINYYKFHNFEIKECNKIFYFLRKICNLNNLNSELNNDYIKEMIIFILENNFEIENFKNEISQIQDFTQDIIDLFINKFKINILLDIKNLNIFNIIISKINIILNYNYIKNDKNYLIKIFDYIFDYDKSKGKYIFENSYLRLDIEYLIAKKYNLFNNLISIICKINKYDEFFEILIKKLNIIKLKEINFENKIYKFYKILKISKSLIKKNIKFIIKYFENNFYEFIKQIFNEIIYYNKNIKIDTNLIKIFIKILIIYFINFSENDYFINNIFNSFNFEDVLNFINIYKKNLKREIKIHDTNNNINFYYYYKRLNKLLNWNKKPIKINNSNLVCFNCNTNLDCLVYYKDNKLYDKNCFKKWFLNEDSLDSLDDLIDDLNKEDIEYENTKKNKLDYFEENFINFN